MLILNLARRLLGYLEICVTGEGGERLLNLCARQGLDLWDIRHRKGELLFCLPVWQRSKLEELAQRVHCQVTVRRQTGLAHDVKKYRRRKVFVLLALAFAASLWVSSQVVWAVYIVGDSQCDPVEMLDYLKGRGLYVGAWIMDVDTSHLESAVVLDHDEIVYCGITRRGTEVYVDLRDRNPVTPRVELEKPCNLVAARDGQITRVQVQLGDWMVRPGEAVRQGQLLASGILDSNITGYRMVHAFGEVYATTYYNKECSQAFQVVQRIPTGQSITHTDVQIFGWRINLSKISGIPYEKYDKMRDVETVRLFGKSLPITLYRTRYAEVEEQVEQLSQQEAVEQMFDRARDDFAEEHPGVEIVQEETSYEVGPEGVTGTIQWECEENIAVEQPLLPPLTQEGL
ncbi:MAG: sporulation protein YqfD [Eubacteriales bacterium]